MKIQKSWFGEEKKKEAFHFGICNGWTKNVWTNSLSPVEDTCGTTSLLLFVKYVWDIELSVFLLDLL